ncbi:MAG TPA: ABC transporter ATP-binding protein [Firmicutes bacterium]|nr:ABC transporter ATP-binding protein [Bacillota bacterium]
MLVLEDVHASYGQTEALRGIDIQINEGEVLCLIGPNGAGKTTTLRTITGLLKPTRGRILLNGEDITKMPTSEIVRRGISCVPEGRQIFPQLTVMENLEMGAFVRRHDRAGIAETLEHVFEVFPVLKERQKQAGGNLSGGQQQMLAIGRALLANPKYLLLDEPSLGLAPVLVDEVFEVIKRLNAEGVTILLVEQNAQMALEVAHRGYVLETGEIVLSGTAQELLHDARVIGTYLGE